MILSKLNSLTTMWVYTIGFGFLDNNEGVYNRFGFLANHKS